MRVIASFNANPASFPYDIQVPYFEFKSKAYPISLLKELVSVKCRCHPRYLYRPVEGVIDCETISDSYQCARSSFNGSQNYWTIIGRYYSQPYPKFHCYRENHFAQFVSRSSWMDNWKGTIIKSLTTKMSWLPKCHVTNVHAYTNVHAHIAWFIGNVKIDLFEYLFKLPSNSQDSCWNTSRCYGINYSSRLDVRTKYNQAQFDFVYSNFDFTFSVPREYTYSEYVGEYFEYIFIYILFVFQLHPEKNLASK